MNRQNMNTDVWPYINPLKSGPKSSVENEYGTVLYQNKNEYDEGDGTPLDQCCRLPNVL